MSKPKLDRYVLFDQDRIRRTSHLNLMVTDMCNLRCWYCYTDGTFEFGVCHSDAKIMSNETFDSIVSFLKNQNRDFVDISMIGGEPIIHPQFVSWINILNHHFHDKLDVHVTTNLTKSLDWWKQFPFENLTLSASYHTGEVDHIEWFEKARYIHQRGKLECVMLVAHTGNLEHLKYIWDTYQDLPLRIQPIHQERIKTTEMVNEIGMTIHSEQGDAFEPEHVEVLLTDATRDDENYQQYDNFKGMMCNNGFVVYPNGDIHYCFKSDKPLGNINDKHPTEQWHICPSSECTLDYEFEKRSIKYHVKGIKDER